MRAGTRWPASIGPGVIYVGNAAYNSDQDIWTGAGSTVTLLAFPNPGYVFAGWLPGPNQVIQGFQDTVTMTAPVSVYPMFQVARRINLATVPAGLEVLADRAPVPTPTTMEWGWDSTHSVGIISPQQDNTGHWWVFSSWSDGGAANHAYQVAELIAADTLTATFVPAAPILLTTLPAGLSLTVDGKSNWPTYNFIWGVGETHSLQAPAQQTDAQGRIWAFASWSNGGPATQSFTVPASAADTGIRLVATYNPVGHLTVNSSISGLTVTVDGANCSTPCDIQRPVGTQVHVSAPASVPLGDGTRADLSGWSGSVPAPAGDWVGILSGDPVAISANYQTMNRLSTAANPAGSASWSVQPGSPDGYYASQTTVNVSVTAQPGYRFHGWSGDLSGSVPSGAVAMNVPRTVAALFDAVPYIAPTGVQNGAGSTPQPGVAPGSVISIFGANLASAVATGPNSPLAQTLSGTVVQAAGRLLPLFFVSPGQINAELPADFAEGAQTLTVSAQGQPDVHASFTVVRNAPGLFQQVGERAILRGGAARGWLGGDAGFPGAPRRAADGLRNGLRADQPDAAGGIRRAADAAFRAAGCSQRAGGRRRDPGRKRVCRARERGRGCRTVPAGRWRAIRHQCPAAGDDQRAAKQHRAPAGSIEHDRRSAFSYRPGGRRCFSRLLIRS